MLSTDRAQQFLVELDRTDLAALLAHSSYSLTVEEDFLGFETSPCKISTAKIFADALSALPDWDKKRILDAIVATDGRANITPLGVEFETDPNMTVPETEKLLPELILEREVMIAVATGRRDIKDENDYYRARRRRIKGWLAERGLTDPNSFEDLWDWYRRWKESFPSYAERREFVRGLLNPLIDRLCNSQESSLSIHEPTGWARVDRVLEKTQSQIERSQHEEDYQTVGLLCREVIISVAQEVFDPGEHASLDGVEPSPDFSP